MKFNVSNIDIDRTVISTFGCTMLFVAVGGYLQTSLIWCWFTFGVIVGLWITLKNQRVI